jgi:hypothetical protein
VVLLQPPRPQVPDGPAHQPRHGGRLLEGHRQGPRDPQRPHRRAGGHEEDARLLPRASPQGPEDALGHARIPPRGHLRLSVPPKLHEGQSSSPRHASRSIVSFFSSFVAHLVFPVHFPLAIFFPFFSLAMLICTSYYRVYIYTNLKL